MSYWIEFISICLYEFARSLETRDTGFAGFLKAYVIRVTGVHLLKRFNNFSLITASILK